MVIIIGIVLIIAGMLAVYNFYNIVDVGLLVVIAGIFLVICGVFSVKAEAETTGGLTAGITKVMLESTTTYIEPVVEEPKIEPHEEPQPTISESDIDLLARLITAEIGYSNAYDPVDYEQLCYLTGSVVINRMKSEKFPNTLEEVIYQPCQYQCVSNGHINREYDEVAWEIAEELLACGTTIDESVLFQSEFFQGSGVYATIHNQYFCYE